MTKVLVVKSSWVCETVTVFYPSSILAMDIQLNLTSLVVHGVSNGLLDSHV